MSDLTACKAEIKGLHRTRATFKSKFTKSVNRLTELKDNNELTASLYRKVEIDLINFNEQIKITDLKINEILNTNNVYEFDEAYYENELDIQTDFQMDFNFKIDTFSNLFVSNNDNINSQNKDTNTLIAEALKELAKINSETKAPNLKCITFEGSEKDRNDFSNFLIQFNNAVGCKNISDSSKMQLLVSYLRGYALKLIQHLPIKNENYLACLGLLKK